MKPVRMTELITKVKAVKNIDLAKEVIRAINNTNVTTKPKK